MYMRGKRLEQYDRKLPLELIPFSQMDEKSFYHCRREGYKFQVIEDEEKVVGVITYKIIENDLIYVLLAKANSTKIDWLKEFEEMKKEEGCGLIIGKVKSKAQKRLWKSIGLEVREDFAYV